jgi:hypothetical protein
MATLSLDASPAYLDDAIVAAMLASAHPALASGLCAAIDHLLRDDGDEELGDESLSRLGAFRDALRGDTY